MTAATQATAAALTATARQTRSNTDMVLLLEIPNRGRVEL